MSWKKFSLILVVSFITLPLGAFISGYLVSKHWPVETPSENTRQFIMKTMVDALSGKPIAKPIPSNVDLSLNFPGPLFVSVISKGKILFRCRESASPLKTGVEICADKIKKLDLPHDSRIRIDIPLSHVVIPRIPIISKLFILPGIEAVMGKSSSGETAYILPDEMFFSNFLASGGKPLKFVKELKMGVNIDAVEQELANRLNKPIETIYRVMVLSLVNSVETPPKAREVLRGNIKDAIKVNGDSVYKAALRGGDYMLRSLVEKSSKKYSCRGMGCRRGFFKTDKGQFLYMYHLTDGKLDYQSRGYYNLPRHAGTTYALANLFRITKLKRFGDGAKKAIAYLAKLAAGKCKGPGFRCIANGSNASLGSTALALVAITEYRISTGDPTYDKLGTQLANFLLYMQRKDGSFRHMYFVNKKKPDEEAKLLYYSGEASLALAKSFRAWKDKRYIKAAEKGLDWLVGPQVTPLPFRFAFGEEHWTCQAARAVWPQVKKPEYLKFCVNFAKYIKRQQWDPQESAFDDFIGGYGFTPLLPPHANGSGSRTESNVSVFELAKFHKKPTGYLKNQMKLALAHILRHQRRPENCWLCANPAHSEGAVASSPIELDIRIDTVQHTTTGLIRAWAALYK
jgi:hypothetical protein